MDDQQVVGDQGDVVGEYVGKVTSYEPAVQSATLRLRAPVPPGARVRILSEGSEWDESFRIRQGLLRRRRQLPEDQEVVIRVRQPVEVGADVFRLWNKAA